ncbi:hypothetical protein ACJX0J_032146, partial [Zea mays]
VFILLVQGYIGGAKSHGVFFIRCFHIFLWKVSMTMMNALDGKAYMHSEDEGLNGASTS